MFEPTRLAAARPQVTSDQDTLLGRFWYEAVTADEGVSLFPALLLLKNPFIL